MSDELFELQDSIRPVLEAAGPAADLETAWTHAVELGWLMTAASEELGGLGLGLASMVLVAAESGRMVSPSPTVSALTAIDVLAHIQNAERVESLMSGAMMAVPLADSAIELASDLLTGTADALPCMDRADAMLLWTTDHAMVCVVPTSVAGLEIIPTPTWDETRSLSRVALSAIAVSSVEVIATGERAQHLIARLLSLRDVLLAADAIGVANGLLATTIEHLSVRYQFGRPLAMFQALKHRVADLRTQLSGAEALLETTVALIEADLSSSDATQASMKACYMATEVCASVAEEGLQLHGGIGMAAEHVCHLYLKRAMLNQQLGRQQGDYAADIADGFIAAC